MALLGDSTAEVTIVNDDQIVRVTIADLAVDDEGQLLALTCTTLEGTGHRALAAPDGREALKVFRAHAEGVDLVILDRTLLQLLAQQASAYGTAPSSFTVYRGSNDHVPPGCPASSLWPIDPCSSGRCSRRCPCKACTIPRRTMT